MDASDEKVSVLRIRLLKDLLKEREVFDLLSSTHETSGSEEWEQARRACNKLVATAWKADTVDATLRDQLYGITRQEIEAWLTKLASSTSTPNEPARGRGTKRKQSDSGSDGEGQESVCFPSKLLRKE